MKYFLLGTQDTEESALFESNELGEDNGFGTFWPGSALKVLMTAANQKPELLEYLTIMTDHKEKISISQFLERIDKLKIRRQ
jgi:hypothetical protein